MAKPPSSAPSEAPASESVDPTNGSGVRALAKEPIAPPDAAAAAANAPKEVSAGASKRSVTDATRPTAPEDRGASTSVERTGSPPAGAASDTKAPSRSEKSASTTRAPAKKKRRRRRPERSSWIVRLFRGVVISAVLAIVAGLAATQTPWGRAKLAALAEQAIHDELGLDASFEEVAVRLEALPPGISIEASGIAMAHPERGTFVEARLLRVRPSLLALLRGRVDLQTIELDTPKVRLVVRDGALVNGPTLPTSDSTGAVELPFERLVVRDAEVVVDVEAELGGSVVSLVRGQLGGVDVEADASGSELDVSLARHLPFGDPRVVRDRLELPGGVLRVDALELEAELELEDGLAAIERFELATRFDATDDDPETPVFAVSLQNASVPFDLANEARPRWNGGVDVTLDLPFLARLPLGFELPTLDGRVVIDGQLEGAGLAIPDGDAHVRLERVKIIERYGLGDFVDLNLELRDRVATIRPDSAAQIHRDGGDVGLSGQILLDLEAGFPLSVQADIRALQFTNLIGQLGVTENSIAWWPLSGVGELEGTLVPFAIEGPLRVRFHDFGVLKDAWHATPHDPIFQVAQGRIQGRWRFDEEAAKFFDLTLDTGRSFARVPMVYLGYAGRLYVEGHFDRLDAADVSPLAGFALAGQGTADAYVEGDFDNPRVHGRFAIRDLQFDGYRPGDLRGEFSILPDYWGFQIPNLQATKGNTEYRVDDFTMRFDGGGVKLAGHLRASRFVMADVYHALRLEEDERYEDYQGVGRGNMTLAFSWGHPGDSPNGTLDTEMDFDLIDFRIDDFVTDRGHFRGHLLARDLGVGLDASELRIDELLLHKGEGTIHVAGEIRAPMQETPQGPRLLGPAQVRLSVAAGDIRFEDTEALHESMPELRGTYAVLGQITGTPDVPRADLDVALSGLRHGDAYLGEARTYVRLTDVTDPWVREALSWTPETIPDEPCAHARYGLAHGRWRPSPPLRTAEGPVERLDRRMAYLVCGEGLEGQVRADLAIGWTTSYPLRGVIDLRDVDLSPFVAGLAPEQELSGVLRGRIALTGGGIKQLDALDGWARFERMRIDALDPIGGGRVRLRNDGAVQLRLVRGGFEIERARFVGGEDTRLEIAGNGDPQGRLALRVDGDLGLGLLKTLSSDVASADGRLTFRVDVRGRADDPVLDGEARVVDGTVSLADPQIELRELGGRITFDGRRAVFEGFDARVGSGRATLGGEVVMRDGALFTYGFDLALRSARVRPDEGIDVMLGGDLRLGWRQGQRLPLLNGELRIERARYERPIQLSPTLGQLYRPQRVEVERYDPSADVVELDLRIVDRSPIRVVNNLFDMDLRIDDSERPMRLVGTNQRYGLLGEITIPRGIVRFRSTELEVSRGEIRFQDETRLDASFDVLAETEIRRQQTQNDLTALAWRISVRAHGDLDAFRLDATSNPALSREDLMLLLTVGMTSQETQQLQAGDVGGTALEALSALTGVNEEVTSAVQVIDEFAITTRYSPQTGRPEPMVTVGKRITDRVRLSAATGLTGEERTFQTGVEWRVGDQTSIQVSYDNLNRESASSFGNLGVDFRWRLEFE